MNTKTIKLFDSNNNLISNFDEVVEEVLISIYGEDYYDVDEELVNTNTINIIKDEELEKTMDLIDALPTKSAKKITIVEKKNNKVGFKDFVPVLFFVLLFVVISLAGYYFINHIDLVGLIK